jgi:hypothetical protein
MQGGFGSRDTTDGAGPDISGCLDTGSTHPVGGWCGFPAVGCLAAGAMSTSPDIGVNAYQRVRCAGSTRTLL